MTDKFTFLDRNGEYELRRWEKRKPDGGWITLYRGERYIDFGNSVRKRHPEDHVFETEAEGRAWLAAQT